LIKLSDVKKILPRLGGLIAILLFAFFFIKNPLDKDFNLVLMMVIYTLLYIVIGIVCKDIKGEKQIGVIAACLIMFIVYFIL